MPVPHGVGAALLAPWMPRAGFTWPSVPRLGPCPALWPSHASLRHRPSTPVPQGQRWAPSAGSSFASIVHVPGVCDTFTVSRTVPGGREWGGSSLGFPPPSSNQWTEQAPWSPWTGQGRTPSALGAFRVRAGTCWPSLRLHVPLCVFRWERAPTRSQIKCLSEIGRAHV